jgi:hypothetical protein
MLQLKDLKVGDKLLMPYFDDKVCIVDKVDERDDEQPIHVVWQDGTQAWPQQRYVCENTVKL